MYSMYASAVMSIFIDEYTISGQENNSNQENREENNYCTLNKDDMQMTTSPSMIYMSDASVKDNAEEFL